MTFLYVNKISDTDDLNIFCHLRLEIALAIPVSNAGIIETSN